MILRRLMAHVKDQNWFAVGLDFVIVVMGVVIGFQITAWAGDRHNKAIEARHLEEIAEDLRVDLAAYGDVYDSALHRIAGVDYLFAEARGESLPKDLVVSTQSIAAPEAPPMPEDQLDFILGWVNLVRGTVGNTSGYDSLISSGDLALVRDRDLARAIQQYYASFKDYADTDTILLSFRNDGVRQSYRLGLSLFGETPVARVIAAVRDDEAFAGYLRTQREWAIVQAYVVERQRERAVALLDVIDAELDARR